MHYDHVLPLATLKFSWKPTFRRPGLSPLLG